MAANLAQLSLRELGVGAETRHIGLILCGFESSSRMFSISILILNILIS